MKFLDPELLKRISAKAVKECSAGEVHIEEKDKAAPGTIMFASKSTTLRFVPWNNNHPIRWFWHSRCADGAILLRKGGELHVHLVELKSKLSTGKWSLAKQQYEGMLANVIAAMAVLGLPAPDKVFSHIAYTELALGPVQNANPVLNKPLLGVPETAAGAASPAHIEFHGGKIAILGRDVEIRKIARDAAGNGIGSLE